MKGAGTLARVVHRRAGLEEHLDDFLVLELACYVDRGGPAVWVRPLQQLFQLGRLVLFELLLKLLCVAVAARRAMVGAGARRHARMMACKHGDARGTASAQGCNVKWHVQAAGHAH